MAGKSSLEIIATGRRNVRSQDSEVWLGQLTHADGRIVPLKDFDADRGWERRQEKGKEYLYSRQNQPAKLRWKGIAEGPMRLSLVSHPWSGVAEIRWNGIKRSIDLFSNDGRLELTLDPDDPSTFAPQENNHSDRRTYASRPPSIRTYANPVYLFSNLWHRRHLIWQFAMRELVARYRGSYLGTFWTILTPLLMLCVYTIVFGFLFGRDFGAPQENAGLPSTKENYAVFPLILFTGLLVFNIFAECANKSPGLITHNPNYVKRVVFPLEILPVSTLIASLLNALIMLALFFAGSILFLHRFCLTAFLFPLVLLPVLMLSLGLGWFFASLGVFIRDIGNAVGIMVSALFFLSAIFFPIDQFGGTTEFIIRLNPLANLVDDARRTLILGLPPHWLWWGGMTIFSALVMQAGYVWFMKSKRWFADVI